MHLRNTTPVLLERTLLKNGFPEVTVAIWRIEVVGVQLF